MLTQVVVWLNRIAGVIASGLLVPIAWLPGWLSATVVAGVSGIVMLVIFKLTSNQSAIRQTRNQINANLLALSLFKEHVGVSLRAQVGLLRGAVKLLLLSLIPMLIMLVPTGLVLGQLSLYYQARPVAVDEETVVTVHLADGAEQLLRSIQLVPTADCTVAAGPVRVRTKNMVCWRIRAQRPGLQVLEFEGDNQHFTKELAVGPGYMVVSLERPSWNWNSALLHPHEPPFAAASAVQSIAVDFPARLSWITGTNSWLIYWFVVSMAAACIARLVVKVSI